MKTFIFKSKLILLTLLLSLFACVLTILFLPYNKAQASTNDVSIEDCDDYIDYFKANENEGLNKYIIMLYEAFCSNIEEVKTGSFEISLKNETNYKTFVNLSNDDKYIAWSGAANALKYDIPELFFVDFTKVEFGNVERYYLTNYSISSSNCYIDGISSQSQLESMLLELENMREEIYSQMDMSWTDYQKVLFVNNYLVDNVEYDLTLNKNFVHTVYGSIVNNLAVCDGYSYGAQYLLDGLGIDNLVCAGYAYNPSTGSSEGHMWSYVKLYGHWYGLDVTWNDPIIRYPWQYSESELEAFKVRYFLKGWDEQTSQGFYLMDGDTSERVVQNYQIYFAYQNSDEKLYYELPYPQIEKEDYAEPIVTINEERQKEGEQIVSIKVIINAQNMLDNMIIVYKYSNDNGLSFGDYTECQNEVIFDNVAQNGVYNFYILSKEGKIVQECGIINVNLGQKYSLTINNVEGVEYQILPNNQTQFYANDYVTINFISFPIGKDLDYVVSEQVEIKADGESCSFVFPEQDVVIDIILKDKLYNVIVNDIEGLEYIINTSSAKFGEQVSLTITDLPIGKSLQGVYILGELKEISLNEEFVFEMPAEDIEIVVSLEDINYNIDYVCSDSLDINILDSAVYNQEIEINASNLPENQKLVISSADITNFEYITNSIIRFKMPAKDISLDISSAEIEKHSIQVEIDSKVEWSINLNEAYFGQEIVLQIINLPENYVVTGVSVNGQVINPSAQNQYIFTMPEEEAVVKIETYNIPNVTITNEGLLYELKFKENNGQFYYLVTLTNLPDDKYVASWSVVDENGKFVNNITQISSTVFQINLGDSDLVITFNLETKAQPESPNYEELDYLLLSFIFIGMVVIIGFVSYMIYKKR